MDLVPSTRWRGCGQR